MIGAEGVGDAQGIADRGIGAQIEPIRGKQVGGILHLVDDTGQRVPGHGKVGFCNPRNVLDVG